jgi:hypothetical protein
VLRRLEKQVWDVLTSLKLAIVCLAALMVLVVACTLAQVRLGIAGAVDAYIRSFVVWFDVPGTEYSIPVFPGGATVGLVLGANLVAAQVRRLELSWRKGGIWLVHAGLILLFVGEFATSLLQVDSRLAIEEGQTSNYVESYDDHELAVIDVTDPGHDDVYGIPASRLAKEGTVAVPGTPLTIRVKRWFPNAQLSQGGGPSIATAGVGPGVKVTERPLATTDDAVNTPAAYVEPIGGGKTYGTWLVSQIVALQQSFVHEGRTYVLALRPRREYLPYAITLKDFTHDVYPGTEIPKNFSSLVHISNPARGEERDVLIYMNQPLRYEGKTFYQASFGKGDTLSILQVVENPSWLLPYVSCVLVALGLVFHFTLSLRRATRRQAQQRQQRALQPEVA